MKVHEAVAKALRDNGVDTLFGVLGDANMLYITDFIREQGGRYLGAVDERGAVLMAQGYARIGNRTGSVAITHGPAVTNALTAIVEAARSRTPLVILTGDTPAVRGHVQHIDLPSLVAPAGAHYQRVHNPNDVFDSVAIAFQHAVANRNPVVLDVPADLLTADVTETRTAFEARSAQAVAPDEDILDRALGVLASARRPLVLAGRGVALGGARAEILALAETIGAPVATTLLARDLFRGDPFDLGVIGGVAHELAVNTLADADCVIAFGASLNQFTTGGGSAFAGKAVIQVDTYPRAFGGSTPVDVAVIGDARSTATSMTELRAADHQPSGFRSQRLANALADHTAAADFTDAGTESTVDVRTAMIRLDELLPAQRVMVTDVGRFVRAPWRYLHVADPRDFTHAASFGSIGLGLATAVGAAAVHPDRTTVAVAGDGGAMMGLIEFSTAVRYRLPLVLVIVNDGAYGAEWTKLREFGADPAHSLIDWPSLEEVGRALGGHAMTVTDLADLDQLTGHLQRGELPLLIDLKVAADVDIGLPA
ncbi:thiamine pyrophosphate-binding protein [Saccharopolyspora sp. K220]|uniref:thiamine pyrophosphate-binding protein n=1 Tax=Saccharopolyspora soli TaxID=2926618 RepID=UPI001F592A0B|nr:thiamine pyrophosphate-binding protein [Saccharopolyspora soli]MCI2420023.1 thiamine pyrophosphate-binding protein [Saccharopolyspora soli]